ncbi:MAG: RNA 2',3'-cyclic phosphodiesterase [Crocinitomicaceae bacterium]|nr:RNA 2',3'-cyclic phosphodiesterase [Crocinitomicaceae bacterium]
MDSLYFIAILTPDPVTKKIRQVQEDFALNYKSDRQLKIPVHVTLIPPFKMKDRELNALSRGVRDCCKYHPPFELYLNGFGAFDKRVIYVDLLESRQLSNIQKDVQQQMMKFNLDVTNRQFKPHITVANRDLKKEQFDLAWQKYENTEFAGSFLVQAVVLLKHNGKQWDVFESFDLS